MNTERKLIFFDIDGTIVTEARDGRIIPDSTRTALRKLQQNGHLCFINTGRALAEIDEPILQLQMDGLVCGCGTYIMYHDNVLAEHTIPFDLGNRILERYMTVIWNGSLKARGLYTIVHKHIIAT